jgi:hypothetical protein
MAGELKGRGNPECYAQALRECRGPVNREHYVSESILELVYGGPGEISRTVPVRGLAFQPEGIVEQKGIAKLVSKILCKGHNSFLGRRFDPAGLAMFKAMEALHYAVANEADLVQTFRVNGDDFERWGLKTFLGGLFSGAFRVTDDKTMKKVYPPPEWLEILFKESEFPEGEGLYWLAGRLGNPFTADEEVLQFEPIGEQGTEFIRGLRVRVFGFNFAFVMGRIQSGGPGLFENVAYRPAGVGVEGVNTRIEFEWQAGPASETIMVSRLAR